jgi:hypothetical protein
MAPWIAGAPSNRERWSMRGRQNSTAQRSTAQAAARAVGGGSGAAARAATTHVAARPRRGLAAAACCAARVRRRVWRQRRARVRAPVLSPVCGTSAEPAGGAVCCAPTGPPQLPTCVARPMAPRALGAWLEPRACRPVAVPWRVHPSHTAGPANPRATARASAPRRESAQPWNVCLRPTGLPSHKPRAGVLPKGGGRGGREQLPVTERWRRPAAPIELNVTRHMYS